jgi:hypothetical protein
MRPVFSRKLAALFVFGCLTAAATAQMYPQPMGYPQQYYGGYPQAYNPYYGYPRNPYYSYVPPSVPVNYYYQTMSPITGTMPVAPTTSAAPPVIAPVPVAPMLPAPVTPPATTIKTAPEVTIAPAPKVENSTPLATPRVARPLPASPSVPKFFVKDSGPVSPEVSLPDPSNCTPQGACTECIKQNCCNNCCCPRYWVDAEFLLWWTKNVPVPTPLVTQATNPTDPTSGAIGSANTTILLGGQDYSLNTRYGGRFTLGGWLDCDRSLGLEGTYLFIAPKTSNNSVSSNGQLGSPVLAIPFLSSSTTPQFTNGAESALRIAGPGLPGSAFLTLKNDLQSGELNAIGRLIRNDRANVVGIVGFRYVNFTEDLDFGFQNSGALGHFFSSSDSFHASNNFYGGQVGLRGEVRFGNLFVNATGKVALGDMNQVVNVSGVSTAVNPFFPPSFNFTNVPSGFFAVATNSGRHSVDQFCVVPEGTFNIGYDITRHIRASVGYDFLYLSKVARPGTEISHTINPTQVPAITPLGTPVTGTAAPLFAFNQTDFWAQGLTFGLEFRF